MRAKALIIAILCGMPLLLLANSTKLPIHYTGAPADGGATCASCHTGASGSGSVSVSIPSYTPNLQQILHVTITDPQAITWGFQMTVRSVSDETQEAGTFTPSDTSTTVRCDDGTSLGSLGPCTGQREFVQHLTAPLTPNAPGSYTFDVLWTPPSQDIGKVVVYAAAVAGNGDTTAGGDRVYTARITVPVIAACNNNLQPVINQVLNSGSLTTTLASGGLWTIKGSNFEGSNLKRSAALGDFTDAGDFPTTLGCIAVTVNGVRQPILYVQTDQINFQGPVVTGGVTINVISNPDKPNQLLSIAPANVTVLPVAPAFLTFNGTSIAARFSGSADIVADPAVVSIGRPAKPGDIVELYAIGFGATDPSVAPGAITPTAAQVTTPVTVTLGGVTLAAPQYLQYVGLTPTAISGLYQLNVLIPAGTPNGDIAVVATAGGLQTQFATIPVSSQ